MKRYFIQQLPDGVTPLMAWENGESSELDDMKGYLCGYSLNQIGPAEVTEAQIKSDRGADQGGAPARLEGLLQGRYVCKLPVCHQSLHSRVLFSGMRVTRAGGPRRQRHSGELEQWLQAELHAGVRAWYYWTDASELDEVLGAVASRDFAQDSRNKITNALKYFSKAIRLLPDTGPNMGTNKAIGNPLFVQEPPSRTTTFTHSWSNHNV